MARQPTAFDETLIDGRARPGESHRWKPSKSRLATTRRLVFERDQWTCQVCGRLFKHHDPDVQAGRHAPALLGGEDASGFRTVIYLELDHVVPYSKGGVFRVANLRAACSPCNTGRGNRRATT